MIPSGLPTGYEAVVKRMYKDTDAIYYHSVGRSAVKLDALRSVQGYVTEMIDALVWEDKAKKKSSEE